jgi:hypothetical protein
MPQKPPAKGRKEDCRLKLPRNMRAILFEVEKALSEQCHRTEMVQHVPNIIKLTPYGHIRRVGFTQKNGIKVYETVPKGY